jgi:hypothetical protein
MGNTDPSREQRDAMVKPVLEPTRTRDTLVQLSLTLQDFQFEHDARERRKTARLMQAALKKANSTTSQASAAKALSRSIDQKQAQFRATAWRRLLLQS